MYRYKSASDVYGNWNFINNIGGSSMRISGLSSGTVYMLRVYAINGEISSEHSQTSFGRTAGTDKPGKMEQLLELLKEPTSITIGWISPDYFGDGEILTYIIR
jgi:hypothetical protein